MYLHFQEKVISKSCSILNDEGSICWQVGNFISKKSKKAEIFPLDILLYEMFKKNGLQLRNRIIWHFKHGLSAKNRLTGLHETILWFTKSDDYVFNLDPIREKQLYPSKKYYKGPNKGKLSGNPLGKNPGDVWEIPNVKANHVEKTAHPCQFPLALVKRLIKSLTNKGDLVVDPFMGSGTTAAACVQLERSFAGADTEKKYIKIAKERVQKAKELSLPEREDKPAYSPQKNQIRIDL